MKKLYFLIAIGFCAGLAFLLFKSIGRNGATKDNTSTQPVQPVQPLLSTNQDVKPISKPRYQLSLRDLVKRGELEILNRSANCEGSNTEICSAFNFTKGRAEGVIIKDGRLTMFVSGNIYLDETLSSLPNSKNLSDADIRKLMQHRQDRALFLFFKDAARAVEKFPAEVEKVIFVLVDSRLAESKKLAAVAVTETSLWPEIRQWVEKNDDQSSPSYYLTY